MEPVSAVLAERAVEPGGLARMLSVSVGAHVVLAAVIILIPVLNGSQHDEVRPVMTISLGGAPGPAAGGTNMMATPPPPPTPPVETKRPEPVRPPPPKPPEMTLPTETSRPVRTPPKAAPRAAPKAAAPAPAAKAAAEPVVDPNRGTGFGGLSTGGGGGTGGYLDVKDFCCPDYLLTMIQLIQRNWNSRQEVSGQSIVMFRIQRDGRITDIELERSSGYAALDLTAQRSLFLTQRLPPLPSAFPDGLLTVHLRFDYQR